MAFVSSGHEALDILAKEPYDIIVTDLRMPVMDGIELLEKVVKNYPGMIRFIFSGQAKKEMLIRSIGPMHQYLTKPCDPEILKSAIERSILLREILTDYKMKEVLSQIRSLPSLPRLYHELIFHIQQDEPSMQRIGAIISKDMGMTAKILQFVNSAFYGVSRKVSDPVQAVTLLGLETIKILIISIHVFSEFNRQILERIPLTILWDHTMNTAGIARSIAQSQACEAKIIDNAYMGGTLHDVGIIILANNFTDKYCTTIDISIKNTIPLYEAEREVFGITHAEIGAYLLGIWGLPDSIVESVCYHHNPSLHLKKEFDHVTAVHVANAIEHELCPHNVIGTVSALNSEYLKKCGVLDRLPVWRDIIRKKTQEKTNE